MQGAEERRLNRMGQYAARRGAVKGNAADDALMVDQGHRRRLHSTEYWSTKLVQIKSISALLQNIPSHPSGLCSTVMDRLPAQVED
jgi:hypothetical protein